jgi:hypothetical protein
MQQREYFYELLIRGTAVGIGGAHYCTMREVVDDDGTVLAAQPSDPIALSLAPSDPVLTSVIGSALAGALASGEAKDAQIAELTAARDTAQSQVHQLQAQLAALQPVVDGVPQFIKKWQLWAGLRLDDPTLATYNAVKAYTEAFTGMKRDLWLDSTGIDRGAPSLADFKRDFHKTDADIDGMFVRYAAITLDQASALA